ncbi:GNAT family N-acetyltransferase [Amycolatopsis sp. H20-H5]|uniref:GNAT family N-acetyltransferase n=1 Tax=Amycolatopsis sp. H20-H5 TaxID=3046309 RepID=UPI002DBE7AC6|nr:GNAT family N-acetyltransferase [Amycolatopsis sp. H20-H5]MEC3979751.1 GNAT family N-acetyltransferase [Amycolatopsis sp. H20-H5]
MNPDEKLEFACSLAWPPLTEETLGEWRLRWADGFTGRANSALAIGDPGVSPAQALKSVCDFAHGHGVPPVVQVVQDSPNERAVEAEGWIPNRAHAAGYEVSVMTGPLGQGSPGATVLDEPTPGWWDLTAAGSEPTAAERHVLTSGKIGYVVAGGAVADGAGEDGAGEDGVTAGAVRGAIVGDWLHVSRLAVRPGFRRRGLAVKLMAALGTWGATQGAKQYVLQVAETNPGAIALYRGLGCTEHHRYRYWVPGECG